MTMITTERLILRPFTENDAVDLFEYLHEPTVHCFFDMKISSMDEAKEEAVKRMETDCYFAIELKDTGKVIGEIFVHPDGEGMEEDCSEGGYSDDTYSPCWMLNKDYHGKGYAYEAANAVFDYLFNEKGARRLYAYTEDYNIASQKLCEKLGMRQEGLFMEFISFVNDENGYPIYENTYQYAILKKEWDKRGK
ncbi:MAG: GNAT family N-acetyltransferase [Clostridia bacterium]|nr:GNAT family N-acetyltransferase [Clostridia bacterium]